MSTTELNRINLHGTKKGKIIISDIVEPYGAGSNDVVSIGIALTGDEVTWKSHIPYENIDELIIELKKAKDSKK